MFSKRQFHVGFDKVSEFLSKKEIEEIHYFDYPSGDWNIKDEHDTLVQQGKDSVDGIQLFEMPLRRGRRAKQHDIVQLWHQAMNFKDQYFYYHQSRNMMLEEFLTHVKDKIIAGEGVYNNKPLVAKLMVKQISPGIDYDIFRFTIFDKFNLNSHFSFHVLIRRSFDLVRLK